MRIQVIQNGVARVFTKTPKYHITPVLKTLHWLKIPERIEYKVISLTHTSILTALLPRSAIHDPITSINSFLFHSNTPPPFCPLVTQIVQSLHSHSCPASLEETPVSIETNI